MSTENVIGDVEAFRRDNLERAAERLYDVLQACRRMRRDRNISGFDVIDTVALQVHDAMTLLEAGGVPTPRLPTAEELER